MTSTTNNQRAEYLLSKKTDKLKAISPFDSDDLARINELVDMIKELEHSLDRGEIIELFARKEYSPSLPAMSTQDLVDSLNQQFDAVIREKVQEQIDDYVRELKEEYNFEYTHGNTQQHKSASLLHGTASFSPVTVGIDPANTIVTSSTLADGSIYSAPIMTPETIREMIKNIADDAIEKSKTSGDVVWGDDEDEDEIPF